jgi:hypothetical protein
VKGKHLFAFSHFPPQQILLKPSIWFDFDLKVLLYHGPKPLFMPFFSFSSIYKLRLHISM